MQPIPKKLGLLALTAIGALLLAACGSTSGSPSTTQTRLVVGAIHVGSIKDAGYNQAEHEGLVYMTQHVPGVRLLEAENVPEDPGVSTVIQNMVNQGATLVFPQSYGYQDFALDMAAKNPSVAFEHPAGYKQAANFGTYWAASDVYSYTLGAAAGLTTKTNKLGFIAGFAIPQIIWSINAFQLGARSVNPDASTVVVFNNTWSDPGKEATATNALADQGVDVVTGIVDSPITFVKTAEQRGIWSIGYHSAAVASYAPSHWISGIDFQFGPYFAQVAQSVIDKNWTAQNYMGDISSGIVKLAPFGKNIPTSTQQKVLAVEQQFQSGALKSPLAGPVYDQSGTLRIKAGETPAPYLINSIDWFAQGVVGQPK